MKVLIAEDDKFISKAFKSRVEKEGIEVMIVGNGQEALDAVKSFSPDLVLLDLIMPIVDGFGFLEKLRADPAYKDIPVVVTSNLGQKEDKKKAMDLGANDYMIKSNSSIEEVVDMIKKYSK